MVSITFSTKVVWSGEGVKSTASFGNKQITIDEPKSLGGTDLGPNPVELLLAGLGGCMNVLVALFAKEHDVVLHGSEVFVEGDLDPDGFAEKNRDVRPGYQAIRYQFHIDSPSSQENIESLIAHVERVCPVKDTLSGVPVVSIARKILSSEAFKA